LAALALALGVSQHAARIVFAEGLGSIPIRGTAPCIQIGLLVAWSATLLQTRRSALATLLEIADGTAFMSPLAAEEESVRPAIPPDVITAGMHQAAAAENASGEVAARR
jgi:hypothetical protein